MPRGDFVTRNDAQTRSVKMFKTDKDAVELRKFKAEFIAPLIAQGMQVSDAELIVDVAYNFTNQVESRFVDEIAKRVEIATGDHNLGFIAMGVGAKMIHNMAAAAMRALVEFERERQNPEAVAKRLMEMLGIQLPEGVAVHAFEADPVERMLQKAGCNPDPRTHGVIVHATINEDGEDCDCGSCKFRNDIAAAEGVEKFTLDEEGMTAYVVPLETLKAIMELHGRDMGAMH
jgi:hypothetical protein